VVGFPNLGKAYDGVSEDSYVLEGFHRKYKGASAKQDN
jgi:hypothetical protein